MSSEKEDKPDNVHSANSWETADLGDKSRNEKFLKLMGASKKEHHGRFVIGENDSSQRRKKKDEKDVEEELVHQYEHSMEHRLIGGRKGHIGLGFHESEQKPNESGDMEKRGDEEKEGKDEKKDEKESQENKEKESSTNDKEESKEPEKDRKRQGLDNTKSADHIKKMKFVQSSS